MEATNPITIECSRAGSNEWTVTIRDGDETLAVNKFDLLKDRAREGFVEKLCAQYPGLVAKKAEIEDALLKKAGSEAMLSERPGTANDENPLDSMPESVKESAQAMLRDPELIRIIVDDIAALGVTGEPTLSAAVFLIGTSRLLEKPLAGIVQGPTSSGKSYIVNHVARLFPPETVIRAHKMTPEALVHMPEGGLVHRFVVAGERSRRQDDKAADATRALREMLSDGHLSKLITLKQPGGPFLTEEIHQPGPIAYVESTTVQNILDEDRNRCIVFNTDERPEQTKRIIKAMAQRKRSNGRRDFQDDATQKNWAAQRMLKQVSVQIPFAEALGSRFPSDRTDARRAFGQVLSMIEAVTLLHQLQRVDEPADGAVITATRDDYEIARRLLAEPMARSNCGQVSNAVRRFHERLVGRLRGEFTTADAMKVEGVIGDPQTVRTYFRTLTVAGHLEVVEPNRGNKLATYRLAGNPPDDADRSELPDPEAIFENAREECA